MNLDKVLDAARYAAITVRGHYDESGSTPQELYAFANEIARIEREECAKLCEAEYVEAEITGCSDDIAYNMALDHAAASIRARK